MGLVIFRNATALDHHELLDTLPAPLQPTVLGVKRYKECYTYLPSFISTFIRNNDAAVQTLLELREKFPDLGTFRVACYVNMPKNAIAPGLFLVYNHVWMPYVTALLRCQNCQLSFIEHPLLHCIFEATCFKPPDIPYYTWSQKRGFARHCDPVALFKLNYRFSRGGP